MEKEVGFYKPILRPAENGAPCFATWKIETPTAITGVNFGGTICVKSASHRATLLHSWDGRAFTADYQKADGSTPFDLVINQAVAPLVPGMRAAYLRYEFETQRNARSYTGPGIQSARIMVQHEPRVKGFTPIEMTYCWIEHRVEGDVERRHTELAASPAHEFTIMLAASKIPP